MRRFRGKKCDDHEMLDVDATAHTLLVDILNLKLKMNDPRVELVGIMNSLRHSAKE